MRNGIRPVISQEDKSFIGFSNLDYGYITTKDLPVVAFGDHNLNIKFIENEFFIGCDGLKVLKTKKDILPKYFYYYLLSSKFLEDLNIKMNGKFYQRHWSYVKEVNIPLLPLEIQHEIVEKLDEEQEYIKQTQNFIAKQKQKITFLLSKLWN